MSHIKSFEVNSMDRYVVFFTNNVYVMQFQKILVPTRTQKQNIRKIPCSPITMTLL